MVKQLHVSTKTQGKVKLCLGPTRLNQALIRPDHRRPHNEILTKLDNANFLSLIDASYGYHNLKLRQEIIILHNICMPIWQMWIQEMATWSSPLWRYILKKIDLPNVFGIEDDILGV